MLPRSSLILFGLSLAAATLVLMSRRAEAAPIRSRPSDAGLDTPRVRDAGPAAMSMPPREWDLVDETVDESFPASDPSGNY